MLNHFQHGVMIPICCFLSVVFCVLITQKIRYVYAQANNNDDEKIITLAPPTLKKYNNQPIMATMVGRKWRGVGGR
jgi:hypothetical protein